VDYGYCGDIAPALENLLPLLDEKHDNDFLNDMRELHTSVEKKIPELCR